MIKNKEDDLVVCLSDSFLPLYLSRPLIIEYFMHNLCFVLNDWRSKQQIILVVPGKDTYNTPTVRELADYFSMKRSAKRISDLRELPIPMYELSSMTGVRIENLNVRAEAYNKQILVMYATYEDASEVRFADSLLAGFQIREDPDAEHPWPTDNEDILVISFDHFRYYKVYSILALLKVNAEIAVQSNLLIQTGFLANEVKLFDLKEKKEEKPEISVESSFLN